MKKKRQNTLWLGFCSVILISVTLISQAYGLAESTGPGGSNAQAVHDMNEMGEGVNIGLVSIKNAYNLHEAFFNPGDDANNPNLTHVFNTNFSGSAIEEFDHDTWMSGIAVSRGSLSNPGHVGVAPRANVYTAGVSFTDQIEIVLNGLIDSNNCRVIMTGLAFEPNYANPAAQNPDGQSFMTLMYDYYACNKDVTFTPGAGNEINGITGIRVFGDMYNGITTGGIITLDGSTYERTGSLSGSGPTDDGRRKPDVGAPTNKQYVPHSGTSTWYTPPWNDGRTSLSGPHTAGAAALLLGLADESGEANDHHSVVIKAAIVNTTNPNIQTKTGASTNPITTGQIWNPDRGYGLIDALRAYQLLTSSRVFPGSTNQQKGWAFSTLAQGQSETYIIDVPKNYRLVATLTWHRWVDWDDEPVDRPQRQNGKIDQGELHPYLADLDMVVTAPGGIVFNETLAGLSPLDNLEKCDIIAPTAGQYTITITNDSSTSGHVPDYGFAFELIEPVTADLNLDYGVDENDLAQVKNNWLNNAPDVDAKLYEDGTINLKDFAVLANNWRSFNPAYYP